MSLKIINVLLLIFFFIICSNSLQLKNLKLRDDFLVYPSSIKTAMNLYGKYSKLFFDSFKSGVEELYKQYEDKTIPDDEVLMAIFNKFDSDQNETISMDEYQSALLKLVDLIENKTNIETIIQSEEKVNANNNSTNTQMNSDLENSQEKLEEEDDNSNDEEEDDNSNNEENNESNSDKINSDEEESIKSEENSDKDDLDYDYSNQDEDLDFEEEIIEDDNDDDKEEAISNDQEVNY